MRRARLERRDRLRSSQGRLPRRELLRFLETHVWPHIPDTVAPVTEAHWRAAAEAFLRYGKGRHPAGLNFGECLTYATARLAGLPLLSKGDDFRATDLASAG